MFYLLQLRIVLEDGPPGATRIVRRPSLVLFSVACFKTSTAQPPLNCPSWLESLDWPEPHLLQHAAQTGLRGWNRVECDKRYADAVAMAAAYLAEIVPGASCVAHARACSQSTCLCSHPFSIPLECLLHLELVYSVALASGSVGGGA